MSVGLSLRERAQRKKLTINQIAAASGLSRQTVRHVLGEKFDHRHSTILKVEKAILAEECRVAAEFDPRR